MTINHKINNIKEFIYQPVLSAVEVSKNEKQQQSIKKCFRARY